MLASISATRRSRKFLAAMQLIDGREAFWIAVLASSYFAAARLGLRLAFVHASATAVWPPSGIAMAALLVGGLKLWPGITLGAFFANILTAGSLWTSMGIAMGNTLEGVVAVVLVNRFARGCLAFDSPRDLFLFVFLAGLSSTTISPTCGISSLCLGGYATWSAFGRIWWTWWLGDATGAVLLTPPLVLWLSKPHRFRPWKPLGAGVVFLVLITAAIVFGTFPWYDGLGLPLSFLCVAPLIWAAFVFRSRGASTLVLLMSALATWGTLKGSGPFAMESPNLSLQILQTFLGTLAVMTLLLASVVTQRRKAMEALQHSQEDLEERIGRRTRELSQSLERLQREVQIRHEAQSRLIESESKLSVAQALAHLGSWKWDIVSDRVSWSDELFRIFGLEPGEREMTYAFFLERVHPDDRTFVENTIRRASRTGEPFGFEHRIVRPDGSMRWLHGLGESINHDGKNPWLHGVTRDITELKRAESDRRYLELELLELTYREQSQLGQDVQNDLGQLLAAIALHSKRLEQQFTSRALPEAAQMEEMSSLVQLAIGKTRSLARVLVCASATGENLPVALRKLTQNTQKLFAVSCQFHDHSTTPLEDVLATAHLFRIAQEAISNALRHGQANRIVVDLSCPNAGEFLLSIHDNGQGFQSGPPTAGFGLKIMRRRAELMGSILQIQTTPAGTTVSCSVTAGRDEN